MEPPARARYEGDGFRFPSYTFRDCFCLVRQAVPGGERLLETARVATAVEREVIMGFVPHHTRPILGRSNRKSKDSWLIL